MRAWRVQGKVVSVHDGDTVTLDLDLGWRITLMGEKLRLDGIDAPELNTAAGKKARDHLQGLLPIGTEVVVFSSKRDKYGRILADLFLAAEPLATLTINRRMIVDGHAKEYHGGKR